MFEPVDYDLGEASGAVIKVIGVGGGGGNAVNYMATYHDEKNASVSLDLDVGESEELLFPDDESGKIIYYAINTDAQALRKSKVQQTIQIGGNTTHGLGSGGDPRKGRDSAVENEDAIRSILEGTNMVFIAAGMGGGTGTGAAPIVAQIAKELGILTVAVVTKPFPFEGKKRMMLAEMGIKELSKHVDSLIVIPNEKLSKVLGKNITLLDAFAAANDVLRNSVMGISDMIISPGVVNVDFADVQTVMSEMGRAMMGTGIAKGSASDGRAEKAAQEAVASPLLEDIDLSGAKGVLINITAGYDLTLGETEQIGEIVKQFAAEDATIITGSSLDPDMHEEVRVTVVATGIGSNLNPPDVMMPPTQGKSPTALDLTNLDNASSPIEEKLVQPTVTNRNNLDEPISLRRPNSLNNVFDVRNFLKNSENK